MKRFKRVTALILALLLLVTALAGCSGKKTDDESKKTDSESKGEPGGKNDKTPEKIKPEFVYVADYKKINCVANYINNCINSGGKYYFTGSYIDGKQQELDPVTGEVLYEYDNYKEGLFVLSDDGATIELLPDYKTPEIPDGMEGNAYVQGMAASGDGGLLVLENVYTYTFDLPENFDPNVDYKWDYYSGETTSFYIKKLSPTGAELASLDLAPVKNENGEEWFYIENFASDDKGNVYVARDYDVHVFNADGTYAGKVDNSADNYISNMVTLADGTVAITHWADMGYELCTINAETKTYGEPIALPDDAWQLYQGGGEYDLYYSTEINFYGFDLKTGESTKIFNWISCNVDSGDLSAIIPLADGKVNAISTTWDDNYENRTVELVTIEKRDASTVPEKSVLTYACMYLDYNIRRQIIDFNKKSDKYSIEVVDYSEYNTNDDYTAGLTKLTTEILSGKVPDILGTSNLPISRYGAKGLLEDLWPYIENDTELGGREGLVQPVLNALSTEDGKLYQITPSFSVYTVMGPTWLVGDKMGWSLKDLYAAYSQMPEGADIFYRGMVKSDVLNQACSMNLGDLVDWKSGKCSFDSQDFIDTLKFVDMFPEEFDWEAEYGEDYVYVSDYERFQTGQQMLSQIYLYDFNDYQYQKFIMGGEVTFVGYPVNTGNGSAFSVDSGLAISSTCSDKEGAWQFVRRLLTKEYQSNNIWNFPTNKEAFDAKVEEATTTQYYTDPVTGEQIEQSRGSWWIDDETSVEMKALTQEEVDQVMDLINSTTKIYEYDDTLYNIIVDQCAAFFAGDKTAEETAKLVQSRMSLYVNEQR